MSIVDVCLYHHTIYNLEEGSVLGKIPKGDSRVLYEYLSTIKAKYNVKLVIMDFNQPLRNAVYSVFPKASIIIHPLDVVEMIGNYLGSTKFINSSAEEIAAAAEEDRQLTIYETHCQGIYDHNSKEEAVYYYRQWQGNVPLGIESFHNVIKTIDYYYEEVFNYYEFKNIFDKEIYK